MTFFRSRWVDAPAHVRELDPTSLPAGFRAAGVAADLRGAATTAAAVGGPGPADDVALGSGDGPPADSSAELDVGVLVSDESATVSAARFTSNARVGAPVIVSRASALERLRVVVANAVCSNTGDGQRGIETAEAMQVIAAELLGVEPDQVGVASTGVIGTELPREAVLAGIRACCAQLGSDVTDFSSAILTSDSGPKRACLEVELGDGQRVRLSAQVKGAGMISPRHATMFCFVQTDALLEQETLDLLTGVCVKRSFDRVSVDGQLSTSDTVFAFANGASGVRVESESAAELALGQALDALMRQLALDMVADGEGARRIGRVVVRGWPDAVEPIARSIANSPLVKTALHGADPNFGRVLQAAGQAWPPGEPFVADLAIEGRMLVSAGDAVDVSPESLRELQQAVGGREVEYELTLPGEGGETEVFFSDLSEAYVRFNAEYTS
ncbi:MAG TPA: bifunctional ornithine acetyltransferase/N-acetylglutamate synthase [Thermoleophilaceae bacterium]